MTFLVILLQNMLLASYQVPFNVYIYFFERADEVSSA